MAYTILNTDGTTLTLLADGTVDKSTTSLTLIGKNKNSYGEDFNNNLIKLLANFASSAGSPPRSPLKGQIWYDTTNKRLKIYDDGFQSVSGATIANSEPPGAVTGDLWYDATNEQFKVKLGANWKLVGPSYTKVTGQVGWITPNPTIKDTLLNSQQFTFLKNFGENIGSISNDSFNMDLDDFSNYMPTGSTSTVVAGLTIFGDIDYTGNIKRNYLSMSVDIDTVTGGVNNDVSSATNAVVQNNAIISLLNKMFPPLSGAHIYEETGVKVGTEARVLVSYTVPTSGYQVRRFIAESSAWNYYVTTSSVLTTPVINLVW
jgi:hypothetical protein